MTKHILYLASGNSRRFGTNKLLAPLAGKPLYRHGLDMLQGVVAKKENCALHVVSQYAQIQQESEELGIHSIDSPCSPLGMSYTIKAGILGLADLKPDDFLLFVVADQPYLQESSVEKILSTACPSTITARLFFENRPGNPVLFSATLVPELLSLSGDMGGGAIIKRHPCIHVQASSLKELMDIDTIEDLQQGGSPC